MLPCCVFIKYCGGHSCRGLLYNQSLQLITRVSYTDKQCTTEKNINYYYKSEPRSPTTDKKPEPYSVLPTYSPSFSSCKDKKKKKKYWKKKMKIRPHDHGNRTRHSLADDERMKERNHPVGGMRDKSLYHNQKGCDQECRNCHRKKKK